MNFNYANVKKSFRRLVVKSLPFVFQVMLKHNNLVSLTGGNLLLLGLGVDTLKKKVKGGM